MPIPSPTPGPRPLFLKQQDKPPVNDAQSVGRPGSIQLFRRYSVLLTSASSKLDKGTKDNLLRRTVGTELGHRHSG